MRNKGTTTATQGDRSNGQSSLIRSIGRKTRQGSRGRKVPQGWTVRGSARARDDGLVRNKNGPLYVRNLRRLPRRGRPPGSSHRKGGRRADDQSPRTAGNASENREDRRSRSEAARVEPAGVVPQGVLREVLRNDGCGRGLATPPP